MQGLQGAQASGFNIMSLQAIGHFIDPGLQVWLFAAFGLAFAIKVPMFPFHTWLPDAHVQAPTAGSVILAGVLLKFGTYGFLRFNLPIFPDASKNPKVVTVMLLLSVIGIIYGALVAMAQKDMKKLIAYSSVSHMGMIMLGIFALNPNGLNGAITQMLNHGVSTSALFLLVGVVYERRHTREISQYGGLSAVMPVYAVIFLIMTLSSIGLPLLNGFIGEFLILNGAFQASSGWWHNYGWTFASALGIILGAAYMLWLYQRVMFGKITNEKNLRLSDLNVREMIYFAPLVVLAFWIGIYPSPFMSFYQKPVDLISYQANPRSVDNPTGFPKPSEIDKLVQNQSQHQSPSRMLLPPTIQTAPSGTPATIQQGPVETGH
jgi:NADH-quinone oxidoreductase subunit M